ncbi:MAG: aminopeptidase P family protein [Endomicrobiales bacterium]|nr:aminopeptidase P family protein [Endomicrobiales bacterium]
MFHNRIGNLIKAVNGNACLITDKVNQFYLTGLSLDGFWLFVSKEKSCLISGNLLASQLKELLPNAEIITTQNYLEMLRTLCKETGNKTLFVNFTTLNYALGSKIGQFCKIADISQTLSELRKLKDSSEIEAIRKSCKLASKAMNFAQKSIKKGISEIELELKIEQFLLKNNAAPAFETIVACGPNSANPHHICTTRKVLPNDLVMVDVGALLGGYSSDLTRTFVFGKITQLQRNVIAAVKAAKGAAVKKLKTGVKTSVIDASARVVIEHAGFGDKFIHTTGHGLGIEVHEAPRLSASDTSTLKKNMFVTIEPGIYLPGLFGVRIEDTYLLTEQGNEVLTK